MKTKLFLFFILSFIAFGLLAQNLHTTVASPSQLNLSSHTDPKAPPAATNFNIRYYAANVCGLNYVSGSVMTQTRSVASGFNINGTGFPATINIAGLPTTCSAILQAYLYYDASYTEATAPATTATITNPALATATYPSIISATGPEKCWGETGTATYYTDVTAAISGNGTYTINLGGFADAAWEVDGCTLFIIYQAGPTTGTTGTLFLLDGAVVENTYTAIAASDESVSGFDACNANPNEQSFFILADQTNDPANYTTNQETANGTTATFTNNMWNFNSIPGAVTSGQTTNVFYPYINDDPTFATPPPYDCYNWVLCGMYYQNTGCTDCLPVIAPPTTGGGTLTNVSCNGANNGSATINVTGGTAPYSYLWNTGATATTINGLSEGTYTVVVEDEICNTTQITFTITQPTALTASTTMTPVTCGHTNGTATVTASGGTQPYTYSWAPAGGNTANATGLAAGTYTATVTDNHACTTTSVITITTGTGPTITISSQTNEPCNGESKGSATAAATGGAQPYTYLWQPAGGTTATGINLSAGTYTVTVTDATGCDGTTSVIITQPQPLTASPTSNVIHCYGATGSIAANTTGGTPPYAYSWNPSGGVAATASVGAGTYTVTITDSHGCQTTAAATLTQPTELTVTVDGPRTVCSGSSATFTAIATGGTTPYTYTWSNSQTTSTISVIPASSQTYSVTVFDANGCPAYGTFSVTVGGAFSISLSGKKSMCAGDSTIICTVPLGGSGPYTYMWKPGNNTTACITADSLTTVTYTLSASDNCGTQIDTTITVYINPTPKVGFKADATQGCVPFCVLFYNTSTISSGPMSYLWTFGNGDSTSHATPPLICYNTIGTFSVTLSVLSDSGCHITLEKPSYISTFAPPIAAFKYSPQSATVLNPTIQFTDLSNNSGNVIYWDWTFGDATDSMSNKENPEHTYQDTGTFCAKLIISDRHGCYDTVTNCLEIGPNFTFYIPSAFTPNGDGRNDVFQPKGTYVKDFEMYIFDRWGEEVYHTTNINDGWNGTMHGGPVSMEDIYVYKIQLTDADGVQHTYVGSVTLIK